MRIHGNTTIMAGIKRKSTTQSRTEPKVKSKKIKVDSSKKKPTIAQPVITSAKLVTRPTIDGESDGQAEPEISDARSDLDGVSLGKSAATSNEEREPARGFVKQAEKRNSSNYGRETKGSKASTLVETKPSTLANLNSMPLRKGCPLLAAN